MTGLVTYVWAKKSYTKEFVSWKNTLQELRRSVTENSAKDANVVERTLQLMDRISVWVPNLPNYKSDEALAYGIVAFAVVAVLGWVLGALAIGVLFGLLVATMVWLYCRYEKRKEAEEQVREFRAWRQKFEAGKEAFLNSI